jgi:probable phosphoglycerate mutase
MSPQRVFLIRHGETEWTLSGQHTGATDLPLTRNGQKAARKLSPILARVEFELVLTSPLQRARNTCALAGLGRRAKIDRDLVEWNYGAYEGMTTEEIRRKAPAWDVFHHGCPGGESPDEVAARVERVIGRVRAVKGHAALFAHGHVLRVLAARGLGAPAAAACHLLLDPAAVAVLSSKRGVGAVKRWNVVTT